MVVRMMQRHPSVVPFLVHISNEAKHVERFAVRSKVMTLRPDGEWAGHSPTRSCAQAALRCTAAFPLGGAVGETPLLVPLTLHFHFCRQPLCEALPQHPHHPGLPCQVR
jgi:hypothetical protein